MRYRQRVLGVLVLLAIITMIDRVCLSIAGKTIQEELFITPSQWGWVLGVFSLGYGFFEVPGGMLGDRIGPRRVLTRIVLWWSAFTALTGVTRSFLQLVVVRFLFGAGEAGAYPNMASVVERWFPQKERARTQGIIWMASRLGGAFSPLLVIPMQQAFGWRATLQIFGVCGAIWAVFWYFWFRDNPAEMRGVDADEREEIAKSHAICPNAVNGDPIYRRASVGWLMLMYFTYSCSGYFYQGWLFTYLRSGRGYSDSDLLKFSWLPFACGALANLGGGFASDTLVTRLGLQRGRRLIGVSGLLSSALLIGLVYFTQDKFLTLMLLSLGYAASDFMLPSAWAACADIGKEKVGTVSGAMNMAGQAGGFASSVAFGYIVGVTGNYDNALLMLAGLTAIAAVLWLKIKLNS